MFKEQNELGNYQCESFRPQEKELPQHTRVRQILWRNKGETTTTNIQINKKTLGTICMLACSHIQVNKTKGKCLQRTEQG